MPHSLLNCDFMRHRSLIPAILLGAVAFVSCKTTEKNYRGAYERAIAVDSTRTSFDQTVYGAHRRAVEHGTITNGTDTIATQRINCKVSPDQKATADSLHRYNVCVASFKQRFNANSVLERLAANGYPSALIVQTPEPYYYVIAFSSNSMPAAAGVLNAFTAQAPFPLPAKPFMLIPFRSN